MSTPTPAQPTSRPVIIDIVSDVVCPWCYVGKRRLESALAQRPDVAVALRWHPFQLDPTIPPGGLDRQEYMARKFGSPDKVAEIHARLEEAGRGEGLAFAFNRISRAVNTLDAHRVLHWAIAAGVQGEAKEALLRAYFMQGRDIGSSTVLADIAASVGMDGPVVLARLGTADDKATIQAEIGQAVRIGVSGVPFFIFARSFAVPGAQSTEILATAIGKAVEEQREPEVAVV